MCGIVGLYLKTDRHHDELGRLTALMLHEMRDRGPEPTVSLEEFMRREAKRLADLTGVLVPSDDPRAFLEGSARLGALEIER